MQEQSFERFPQTCDGSSPSVGISRPRQPLRCRGPSGSQVLQYTRSVSPFRRPICASEDHGPERSLTSDRSDDGIGFRSPVATISARRNPALSTLLSDGSASRNRTNASAPAAFSTAVGMVTPDDAGAPWNLWHL